MADNGLLVTVSGATLSLLLYENVRSVGDQIGFLVGEVVVFVTKSVTDADRQIEVFTTHVNVNTVITCPASNFFCNSLGKVDQAKLKELTKNKGKRIVGWFRFRRNGSLVPTMRDKILHKQLRDTFFPAGTTNHECFTMCLLNTSVSDPGGTHKFRHVFLRHKNGVFEPISLRINNLGDDSSRPDGSDYKPTPTGYQSSEEDAFTKILKTLDLNLSSTPASELVTLIQRTAEKYLDSLIPRVSASDREIAALEKQVAELQLEIFRKKMSSNCHVNESSNVNSKNQTDKQVDESKKKPDESKISVDRLNNELIDMFNENSKSEYNVTETRHPSNCLKQNNLVIQSQPSVTVAPKNINEQRTNISPKITRVKPQTSSVSDPFASVVADLKMDMTENSTSRNRRSQSKDLGSSPDVVTSNSGKDSSPSPSAGIGRGIGRGVNRLTSPGVDSPDGNYGSKKPRRTRSKLTNEKVSSSSPMSTCVKSETSSPLSYSQATRKMSDTSPPRVSESQEY